MTTTYGSLGVVFRHVDDDNYYLVSMSTYCVSLVRRTNGVSQRLSYRTKYRNKIALTSKRWYTVTVQAVKSDIQVWLNVAGATKKHLVISYADDPLKLIPKGGVGFYTNHNSGAHFRKARVTTEICKHMQAFNMKEGATYDVISVMAEAPTTTEHGAFIASTSDGLVTGNHWNCTSTKPADQKWTGSQFVEGPDWSPAVSVSTPKGAHAYGVNSDAKWIWGADKTAKQVYCRAIRGEFNVTWNDHTYEYNPAHLSWYHAELACQKLGPNAHLASVESQEENDILVALATGQPGKVSTAVRGGVGWCGAVWGGVGRCARGSFRLETELVCISTTM